MGPRRQIRHDQLSQDLAGLERRLVKTPEEFGQWNLTLALCADRRDPAAHRHQRTGWIGSVVSLAQIAADGGGVPNPNVGDLSKGLRQGWVPLTYQWRQLSLTD